MRFSRKMGLLLAAAGLLFLHPAWAGEARFFSLLNDVPLMAGLYELPKDNLSFDKPEGRIVETAAASESDNVNKIKAFYQETLPQLGWIRAGDGLYLRAGEQLTLHYETRPPLNIVHLSLSPRK